MAEVILEVKPNSSEVGEKTIKGEEETPTKHVVKERMNDKGGQMHHVTRIADVYAHLQKVHSRMDVVEEAFSKVAKKLDSVLEEVKGLKDIQSGRSPEFEQALRTGEVDIKPLNPSLAGLYGDPVSQEIAEIIREVIGTDVRGFMKVNPGLPSVLFTLLVPKRLSKLENDFRSSTVYNASVHSDVKKWCEKVKSNLFRQYAGQSQGVPKFLIPTAR